MNKFFTNTKLMLATPRGFCAGVERAVDIVNKAIDLPQREPDILKFWDKINLYKKKRKLE